MGEWRRGKWVRWISATQRIDPETGQVITAAQAYRSTTLNESAIGKQSAHFMTFDQSSINGATSNLN